MSPIYLILSLFYIFHHVITEKTNPPWKKWTFCKNQSKSRENNLCLIKAIQDVENDMVHGNSYFGTPTFEPLRFEELSMFKANQANNPVAVNITFRNCNIDGLRKWHMKEAIGDWDHGDLKGRLHVDGPIRFLSDYNINGKILLLPIVGNGKASIIFEDMDSEIQIKGKTIQKKGKKYFSVDSFDVELLPNKLNINLENLFNGNKALSDTMNKFLNENWREIIFEVKKPISEALGTAFKLMSQRVFSKIPMDQLVPN